MRAVSPTVAQRPPSSSSGEVDAQMSGSGAGLQPPRCPSPMHNAMPSVDPPQAHSPPIPRTEPPCSRTLLRVVAAVRPSSSTQSSLSDARTSSALRLRPVAPSPPPGCLPRHASPPASFRGPFRSWPSGVQAVAGSPRLLSVVSPALPPQPSPPASLASQTQQRLASMSQQSTGSPCLHSPVASSSTTFVSHPQLSPMSNRQSDPATQATATQASNPTRFLLAKLRASLGATINTSGDSRGFSAQPEFLGGVPPDTGPTASASAPPTNSGDASNIAGSPAKCVSSSTLPSASGLHPTAVSSAEPNAGMPTASAPPPVNPRLPSPPLLPVTPTMPAAAAAGSEATGSPSPVATCPHSLLRRLARRSACKGLDAQPPPSADASPGDSVAFPGSIRDIPSHGQQAAPIGVAAVVDAGASCISSEKMT